ncbi:hypothetical protein ALPO108162_08565 [Alicyclobacillus pomorum]|nr:hypothetical protein [Alicyclobacillus pomorum]
MAPDHQDEALTMSQRIEAFYRQSGGPNNPDIDRLLEKHLLYGKDHGMPGYKETIEDAFIDTVVNDPALLILFQRFQRLRHQNTNLNDGKSVSFNEGLESVHKKLAELQADLELLRLEVKDISNELAHRRQKVE